jgi:integrase
VETKEVTAVEKLDFTRFLETAKSTRLYPLILLAAATGARRGELLVPEWSDLVEPGVLKVSKSPEETRAGVRVKSTKSGKAPLETDELASASAWEDARQK